jgi:peptidoglycan hydrolase-like protein with peptidoglycan-binding domain
MNYRSLPIVITVSLTFIGISLSNQNKLVLSQISPNSSITLIVQASNTTTTTLQLGDRGETVKLLQNTLKSLGYLKGKINGVFDEDTKKAVSEFQRKQGLRVNGIANANLQELLQRNLFDQYMNLAYTATENKDYQLAKKQFEQALKILPNNIYAEKAITNINTYLEKSAEEVKKQQEQEELQKIKENLWLIALGSILFLIFIFGLLITLKKYKNNKKEELPLQTNENIDTEKSDLIKTNTEISNQDDSSSNNSSLSLPLHKDTKHLKKVDGIEELIKDLKLVHGATRRKAIWELAQRADSRAMQPLVQLMIEADSQERSLILEAISQISTRTLKPLNRALAVSLQDENAQVRLNAIRDLTRIYELIAEVNQRLYHATDDEDQEVRETATWALKNLTKMQLPYHQDHQDEEN